MFYHFFTFRFAPDNEWFIETMNSVFEIGGDLVRPQVAQNLMRLIGEGKKYQFINIYCFI